MKLVSQLKLSSNLPLLLISQSVLLKLSNVTKNVPLVKLMKLTVYLVLLTESTLHIVTVLMDTSKTLMKIVLHVTIHVLNVMNMLVNVLLVLLTESLYHIVTVQINISMKVSKIVNLVQLHVNSVLLLNTVLHVNQITI
jgi:hypothetical protein